MSFVSVNIKEQINKRMSESTDFKKKWEDSCEEYRLMFFCRILDALGYELIIVKKKTNRI